MTEPVLVAGMAYSVRVLPQPNPYRRKVRILDDTEMGRAARVNGVLVKVPGYSGRTLALTKPMLSTSFWTRAA